jgi:hypothetical protein
MWEQGKKGLKRPLDGGGIVRSNMQELAELRSPESGVKGAAPGRPPIGLTNGQCIMRRLSLIPIGDMPFTSLIVKNTF